jgi:O-antigen/teichoic acid export membrane protein
MTTLILIAVVCILLAFFHNPFAALLGVSDTFLITSLFVAVILSMRILFEAFLRGFGRFKKQSVVRIFESLTVLFVFFVLAEKGGLSYRSYVGAIISGYLVFIVLNLNIFIGFARIEFMKPIGILIRYGSFTVFGSIFGILTTNMDKIFVNMYLGRDQLGIYTAYSTVSLLLMGQLATIFVNVFFQHLSVRDDHDRLLRKMKIIAIVSYLPILLILCVAISVSMAFFGDKYPLDFSLVMQFGFLGTTYLYFLVLWWMINSKGERGIRFTSFSGLFFGLSFIGLLFIFRDTLTIGMVADFLSGLLLVAILWGGLRYAGLKKG